MAKEKLSAASTQPVDLDNKPSEDLPLDDSVTTETAQAASTTEEPKSTSTAPAEDEENAPPRPPRPESPILKLQREMKEAFPDVDEKTIYAILIASRGQQEYAFNALLYLSDPSYKPEIALVEQPVTTSVLGGTRGNTGTGSGNTEDDERLARELQKEFEQEERMRRREYRRAQQHHQHHQHQLQDAQGNQDLEIPDEFEQIKETFAKGVEDARSTINGWVSSLAKKIDNKKSDDDENDYGNNGGQGNAVNSPKLFGALGGSSVTGRTQGGRQGGKARFDEDPVILSSGVNLISLHNQEADDSEGPALPKRKESPGAPPSTKTSAKPSKWQPLNSDVPVNSDAFLVTDSDDELESKKEKK
ncbi:ubiquitin-binding protein cue5 [Scheffersomyces spartinae]|uniref:Ubiquitin-binding protein cue5 n=1 Tax=Scheffersomyces spartinae TaxID=45513 RepID=A0A9P7V671_9ASCO|nr:ubiquitin-binding protein cue5 [Scheffersomyces spartinae]KAG7192018.1 ubiquitin-binding protein cue5 [Scheffersomyces spartinae]